MTTETLATTTSTATAAEIRAQVNLIQEVMRAVMKEGTHYGTIPGTPKPTLYKAGSEKILCTFRIGVDPEIEDLSIPGEEARFRVRARGISQGAGVFLGAGVGECSSSEEKYRWRAAVHDKEWDATPEDRRRIKYTRDGDETRQVRTNPADIANTVLKMAKKRAQIDMTLTVTAASDVFAQDIEDLPPELQHTATETDTSSRRQIQAPQRRSAASASHSGPLPDGVVRLVRVDTKEGTSKKGTAFTKFTITDSQNRKFSTFSETDANAARRHIGQKTPVQVEFESGQYGNNLKRIIVWEPPEVAEATVAAAAPVADPPAMREPGEEG